MSKFSEDTVTREIISRGSEDSSTDVAIHHKGFEEEQKSKGKGFLALYFLLQKPLKCKVKYSKFAMIFEELVKPFAYIMRLYILYIRVFLGQ